jgi:hypothetical protein
MKHLSGRIASILVFLTLTVFAQNIAETNLRTLHLFRSHPHDPVAIVKLMRGAVEIQPDIPFEAGDDWLKEISVVVRNISTSKITYISVAAHLPETGDGTKESPRVGGGNAVGKKPEHAMYSALTGERRQEAAADPIDLEPGKDLAMPLIAERDYTTVKSLIEATHALSTIRTCDVWVTTIFFDDGTKWAPTNYWRPQEAKPGAYISIPFEDWLQMQQAHQVVHRVRF